MGITSGHATCRLVVLDGRVERISLVTESHFLKSCIVRIVSEYTDFVVHCLLGILLRFLRSSIDNPHRHSEFQGIGKLAPLHSCSVIYRIRCGRNA